MDSRHPLRTVAMALLVISLVAGSAACGPASVSPNGSASPASPGASPSPSASAGEVPLGTAGAAVGGALGGTSPAPSVDVAALFTKAMRVPFRANASVEGEMTRPLASAGGLFHKCKFSGFRRNGESCHEVIQTTGDIGKPCALIENDIAGSSFPLITLGYERDILHSRQRTSSAVPFQDVYGGLQLINAIDPSTVGMKAQSSRTIPGDCRPRGRIMRSELCRGRIQAIDMDHVQAQIVNLFEALRDRSDAYLERTGSRPQVLLLPLGPLAEHNIRTTFPANLFASGGIEAVHPGTVDAAGVAQTVLQAGTLCSPYWSWWGNECVNGIFATDVTVGSRTSSAPGFNVGGGLTYRMGDSPAHLYVEVRYHQAFTRNVHTVVLPLTLGIRF